MNKLNLYLKPNIMGAYEIAFLPIAAGIDEQDWEWVEDIQMVRNALNIVNK